MKNEREGRSRFFARYSLFDLILIAMLSALSIAVKTVAGILVRMITGPLGIPGGALAGGFYMLWLPISAALVKKRGAAFLVALVQTLVLLITGAPGSHGVWMFLTYLLPAVAVELVFLVNYKKRYTLLHFVLATLLANLIGTFGSNLLFFRLSLYPLLFTLACACFSGAVGGLIGYYMAVSIEKSKILPTNKKKVTAENASADGAEKADTQENPNESHSADGAGKADMQKSSNETASAGGAEKADMQERSNETASADGAEKADMQERSNETASAGGAEKTDTQESPNGYSGVCGAEKADTQESLEKINGADGAENANMKKITEETDEK